MLNLNIHNRFRSLAHRSRGFEGDPRRSLRIDPIRATCPVAELYRDAGISYSIGSQEKPVDQCRMWVSVAVQCSRRDDFFCNGPGGTIATMMLRARTILIGFLFAVPALLAVSPQVALAETSVNEDPQQLVADTINELIDRLKENSEQIHKDDSIAHRISNELVAPHIDFPRVTRLVIGKYWQTASEQQRQALIAEIQALMIRSYVTAMTSYADQIVAKRDRINFLPSRYQSGDKRASVRASITLDTGQAVEVQYHLYNGDGKWRIYDIVIEGVSLAITYRSNFGEQIKRGGLDSLIAQLSERNRKGEVELAPSAITRPIADKNAL